MRSIQPELWVEDASAVVSSYVYEIHDDVLLVLVVAVGHRQRMYRDR